MNLFRSRILSVMKALKKVGKDTVFLLTSASPAIKSRNQEFPFRQDSDFYYLTGSIERDQALLISADGSRPELFVKKVNKLTVVWEGKPLNPEPIAKQIGAKLIYSNDLRRSLLERLKGKKTLVYQNTRDTVGWRIAEEIIKIPSHLRTDLPSQFLHSDQILEEMRLIKSSDEVDLIRQAAEVTGNSLYSICPLVKAGTAEWEIEALLSYQFKYSRCGEAFNSIVAAGRSASVLHYHRHSERLKRGEMLLIDCGASYKMYGADMTRVLPVDGRFSGLHREIYSIVLEAQEAAIKKVTDGVQIRVVYDAAARVLTQGLISLGVLKGKLSSQFAKGGFKPYFPHGIGHSLGIDTHDIGRLRGNLKATLRKGMVFTVEPGLYFSKKIGKISPCGVRIEDDILVTNTGSTILSDTFPKSIKEIEGLF